MEDLIRAMMDMIASKVCGKAIDKSKYEFTDDELCGCTNSQKPMTLTISSEMR